MAVLIDPYILLEPKDKSFISRVVAADPTSGYFDGEIIVNTTDNVFRIWYKSTWNTLGITITPGAPPPTVTIQTEDGLDFSTEDGKTIVEE